MSDTYIADSQAPALGLYLKLCYPNDRAYDVYRAADDECLLVAGNRVQVTAFLRGYEAALKHPALVALSETLANPAEGNAELLDAAQAVDELPHPRRCTVCRCEATGAAFGFPVCDYHAEHGEDDAPCPKCAVVALHGDERLLVAVGDRVRDPQDGAWREIVRIDDDEGTCYMADGGCMSVAECAAADKRLPSEDLS